MRRYDQITSDEERCRAFFYDTDDDGRELIASIVDEWREAMPPFEGVHFRALRNMKSEDLAAAYKRDPSLIGRVQDAIEKQRNREELKMHVIYEITPYQIQDESVEEIIRRGPDALYLKWEEAMLDRAAQRGIEAFIDRCNEWLAIASDRLKSQNESVSATGLRPTSEKQSTPRSMTPTLSK